MADFFGSVIKFPTLLKRWLSWP